MISLKSVLIVESSIYDVKFVSEYEPKARLNENPFEYGTQVSMINKRRVKRNTKTESSLNIYTILYNF